MSGPASRPVPTLTEPAAALAASIELVGGAPRVAQRHLDAAREAVAHVHGSDQRECCLALLSLAVRVARVSARSGAPLVATLLELARACAPAGLEDVFEDAEQLLAEKLIATDRSRRAPQEGPPSAPPARPKRGLQRES